MRPRAELQTHIHSWAVGRKVEHLEFHEGHNALLFRLSGDVTLRVKLAARKGWYSMSSVPTESLTIAKINIHEGARTFGLWAGTRQRVLDQVGFPEHFIIEWAVLCYIPLSQPQPVKIFKQGRDVTGEFDESKWEGDEGQPKQAFTHSWSPSEGFKTEPASTKWAGKFDPKYGEGYSVGVDYGSPDGDATVITETYWDEERGRYIQRVVPGIEWRANE
jgi:hypothetical protein